MKSNNGIARPESSGGGANICNSLVIKIAYVDGNVWKPFWLAPGEVVIEP